MTRILVVDDEPDVLEAVVAGVRHFLGAEVEAATSGEEAHRRLSERSYDVVITDERLPGISGSDLLRWAAEGAPRTRRILMTAYVGNGIEERLRRAAPVEALLRKPFDIAEATVVLRRLLGAVEEPPLADTQASRAA